MLGCEPLVRRLAALFSSLKNAEPAYISWPGTCPVQIGMRPIAHSAAAELCPLVQIFGNITTPAAIFTELYSQQYQKTLGKPLDTLPVFVVVLHNWRAQ